jgi:hypothetical protein
MTGWHAERTPGRSAKAVIAVTLLALLLLLTAVPVALLAAVIMMILGHVVGGLALDGGADAELPAAFGEAAENQLAGVGGDGRRQRAAPPQNGVGGGGPAGLPGERPSGVAQPFSGERDAGAQFRNRFDVAGWSAGRRNGRRHRRQQPLPGCGRGLQQVRRRDASPGCA